MCTNFLWQDNGEPDVIAPQSEQHALEDLPVEVLIYLLGSSATAIRIAYRIWRGPFRAGPEGWPLVKAICDYVHDRISFGYEHASNNKIICEMN